MAVKKQAEEKPATTELTVQQRHEVSVRERFSDDDLRKVDSFEAAMSLAIQAYGNVESVTDMELGNGFRLIKGDDLERLIGVSFVILHMTFNEGDFNEFVTCTMVTKNNDRFIMNGGKEIVAQLKVPANEGRYGGILVPRGLRVSKYDICPGPHCGLPRKKSEEECEHCGDTQTKRGEGRTFYLDVSE